MRYTNNDEDNINNTFPPASPFSPLSPANPEGPCIKMISSKQSNIKALMVSVTYPSESRV